MGVCGDLWFTRDCCRFARAASVFQLELIGNCYSDGNNLDTPFARSKQGRHQSVYGCSSTSESDIVFLDLNIFGSSIHVNGSFQNNLSLFLGEMSSSRVFWLNPRTKRGMSSNFKGDESVRTGRLNGFGIGHPPRSIGSNGSSTPLGGRRRRSTSARLRAGIKWTIYRRLSPRHQGGWAKR